MINAGPHLFEKLGAGFTFQILRLRRRPRLLLNSISVEANDANFRELFRLR